MICRFPPTFLPTNGLLLLLSIALYCTKDCVAILGKPPFTNFAVFHTLCKQLLIIVWQIIRDKLTFTFLLMLKICDFLVSFSCSIIVSICRKIGCYEMYSEQCLKNSKISAKCKVDGCVCLLGRSTKKLQDFGLNVLYYRENAH